MHLDIFWPSEASHAIHALLVILCIWWLPDVVVRRTCLPCDKCKSKDWHSYVIISALGGISSSSIMEYERHSWNSVSCIGQIKDRVPFTLAPMPGMARASARWKLEMQCVPSMSVDSRTCRGLREIRCDARIKRKMEKNKTKQKRRRKMRWRKRKLSEWPLLFYHSPSCSSEYSRKRLNKSSIIHHGCLSSPSVSVSVPCHIPTQALTPGEASERVKSPRLSSRLSDGNSMSWGWSLVLASLYIWFKDDRPNITAKSTAAFP